jgi:hypothetical protein
MPCRALLSELDIDWIARDGAEFPQTTIPWVWVDRDFSPYTKRRTHFGYANHRKMAYFQPYRSGKEKLRFDRQAHKRFLRRHGQQNRLPTV